MKWIDRPTGEQPLLKKENALKTYPLGGVEKSKTYTHTHIHKQNPLKF